MNTRVIFSACLSFVLLGGGGNLLAQFTFGEFENLGTEVNDPLSQTGPCLSSDGLEFFFTSGAFMPGASGNADIYVRTRETVDAPWGAPQSLGPQVNSSAYEGEPTVSADRRTLYFSDGNWVGSFPRRPGGLGNADIWRTRRESADGEWAEPVLVDAPVSSRYMDSGPSLSADGLSLYFASNRPGGAGRTDIWVARRAAVGDPWETVENLGAVVNSSTDDMDPAISHDGLFLFFNSFRTPNYGYIDLWVSTRASTSDPWGAPRNLGPVINTNTGDVTPAVSSDGRTLFFSHWHEPSRGELGRGGSGQMDIWQVPIVSYPPTPWFTVSLSDGEAPVTIRFDGAASRAESGREIVSYEWDFGHGDTATGVEVERTYDEPGVYSVTLSVTDDAGASWEASRPVTVGCPAGDVAPWSSVDVGEPLVPGAAVLESNEGQQSLSLCAAGSGLSGPEDSFHFVYQELSGDSVLTARIESSEGGLRNTQVGMTLRESLEPSARHASMVVRGNSSRIFRFVSRDTRQERSSVRSGPRGFELPDAWVRIRRQGTELIGLASTDGIIWEEVERKSIQGFPESYLGGIVVASGEPAPGTSFGALQAQVNVRIGTPRQFRRGDCNDDGVVDISDAIFSLGALFLGDATPECDDACDSNDDGTLDISDAIATLGALFIGEGPIPAPGMTACGVDPTEDELDCETHEACP